MKTIKSTFFMFAFFSGISYAAWSQAQQAASTQPATGNAESKRALSETQVSTSNKAVPVKHVAKQLTPVKSSEDGVRVNSNQLKPAGTAQVKPAPVVKPAANSEQK